MLCENSNKTAFVPLTSCCTQSAHLSFKQCLHKYNRQAGYLLPQEQRYRTRLTSIKVAILLDDVILILWRNDWSNENWKPIRSLVANSREKRLLTKGSNAYYQSREGQVQFNANSVLKYYNLSSYFILCCRYGGVAFETQRNDDW